MKRWLIVTVKPCTKDRADILAEYENRGHAVSRLRGLRRQAWAAASEMEYRIEDGRIRGGGA